MKRKRKEVRELPEVRVLSYKDINFRLSVAAALSTISHYAHPAESRLKNKWSENRIRDLSFECARMGLLVHDIDHFTPTPLGIRLLETKDMPSFAESVRQCFETCDPRFRYVWAAICESVADRNGRFAKRQVTEFFLNVSRLSGHPFKKGSASTYTASFLGWAKAAGICEREKYGVYKVKRRYELLFQLPTGPSKMGKMDRWPPKQKEVGADFEVPILRLNALISDLMANENNEDDLKRIDDLLRSLRGSGVIDEIAIDFLDDAIKTAISSEDSATRILVGKLLKRLRTRYLERPQLRLSVFD